MEIIKVLGTVAMDPKGEYDSSAYYEKLNTVLYNDSTYMAIKPSNNVLPTNTEYWQLIGGGLTRDDIVDNLTSNDATKMLSAKQGKELKSLADQKPYYFDTVSLMKAATLKAGDYAVTKGYYAKGDRGGYTYKIRATESSDSTKYQNIILDNGLCAELIIENNFITPEMFGAYGDFTTDDSVAIQRAFDFATENGYTLYFQKNYYMGTGIKVKSVKTKGNTTTTLIKMTGDASLEWTYSNRNDRTSKIKVNDHFIGTDVVVDTSNANSLAYITIDIGYLTIDSNNSSADYYLFNCISLFRTKIHDLVTRGFAGVLYGGMTNVTHIQNNHFLACHGICFKSFETAVTLFTDCYIHDNYINGGSSSTQGNLFAFGNGHNFYLYNNYIDFFNYIFKCLDNSTTFSYIHSNNNTYDQFISMNAKRNGTHAWNDTFTGFKNCFFINDRFGVNNGSFSGYLPDEKRCIFDMSPYATNSLTISGCEITDNSPCLFYSSQAIYYANATSANYKRVFVTGNQCNNNISNQFTQLIQCSPSNERGQYTIYTDMIDDVSELPAGTQFNGRRVIYNGNLYEYFGGWKTIYNS